MSAALQDVSQASRENAEPVEDAISLDDVQEYLTRRFQIEREIKVLQADRAELKEEFRNKNLDVSSVDRAITAVRALAKAKAGPETMETLMSEVSKRVDLND